MSNTLLTEGTTSNSLSNSFTVTGSNLGINTDYPGIYHTGGTIYDPNSPYAYSTNTVYTLQDPNYAAAMLELTRKGYDHAEAARIYNDRQKEFLEKLHATPHKNDLGCKPDVSHKLLAGAGHKYCWHCGMGIEKFNAEVL